MSSKDDPASRVLAGVVPRWEWRAFGRRFGVADEQLAAIEPEREATSRERYLLSIHTDASVKVRDGLLDVKECLAVDDNGLELWAPTLKAEFPAAADDVESVLGALGVTSDRMPTGASSVEKLDDLIGTYDGLRTVAVVKERRHFRLDGCVVESTEITADGHTTRTVSVESEDAQLVDETVHRLGLAERPNLSVSHGLDALLGFGSSRIAVIDVGTNSVKFHLEERLADGTSNTLVDRADVTRLGEGQADSGELAETAMVRTVESIVAMAADAREIGPVDIVAVGTAGLRRAPNRAALVDAVRELSGVDVEVISGPEEARLAYLAATAALPPVEGPLAVFDSGGGSTQFTFGQGGRVDEQFSLDVGAARITERFGLSGPVSLAALEEASAYVAAALDRLDARTRPEAIVAIGGTATNLAAVSHGLTAYDPDVVHGTVIDRNEVDRQIELYRTRSADERRLVPGLQAARAEVILGGCCIVRTVLAKLDHDVMTVSDRGLRHGVVIDRFGHAPAP